MPRIAPEGWAVIGTAAAVFGVVAAVGTAAGHPASVVPLVVAVGLCLWFFRDPERETPSDGRVVVSPADGRVVDVTTVDEPTFLGARVSKISIFMSPLDVHVNRSPVDGRVVAVEHTPGRFRAAWEDKASLLNERNAMLLENDGRRYLVVQVAGALARRIICHRGVGDRVARGERYGVIMFGSRVDLYVPAGVVPVVTKGARVQAGSSAVARIEEA